MAYVIYVGKQSKGSFKVQGHGINRQSTLTNSYRLIWTNKHSNSYNEKIYLCDYRGL
jgi:hypothetical protein